MTAYSYGTTLLTEAQRLSKGSKSDKEQACTVSKNAQTAFATAQMNVPKGGKSNPQAAQQVLTGLGQVSPYADQFVKATCK